ncbi:MAG: hypothetical protein HOQ28_14635, partial [Thermoleophilia bacterium]|nr:hypothetical protein [Thermoleophilia bacterium]
PIASAVVHTGVDAAVDNAVPGPSSVDLINDNADARALVSNSLHASVAAGYYQHGYLQDSHPPAAIVNGNQLISYSDAQGEARWHYEEWLNGNSQVEQVSRNAMSEVTRAFSDHSIDLVR